MGMATTRLMRIKSSTTKSISHILKDRTEYIENNKKTNNKELVSSFNCIPESAYLDFTASKILYDQFKGTESKKKDDVLAYHIRQAFSPEDKITPEKAHEIGKKLVEQFTKGNHEYVIATHIDKNHIHNHIIFNSTTIDCTRKFNNYYNSAATIRKISDKLCRENNLSVVEPKAQKGQHYKEWLENKKGESWKSKLKRNIDMCIECCTDIEEFKRAMRDLGYEIKEGKHIAFRAKGQERFTRAKTLGDDYTQESIVTRIEKRVGKRDNEKTDNKHRRIGDLSSVIRLPFTVDKQLMYIAKKRRISDLKSLANTLMMIRNENIQSRKDFAIRIGDLQKQALEIKEDIKKLDGKIKAYSDVAKYLATVNKHKDLYKQYGKCSVFSKKEFYNRHEGEILSYEYALKKLEKLGINIDIPLDKVASMANEYRLQADALSKEFSFTEKRIELIENAEEIVNEIQYKDFNKKVEQKKLREENL